MIGRSQRMKRCRPPKLPDQLVARARGRGGTCCRAPCRSRARRPRATSSVLTTRLRRERDEGRRADLAVGELQRAGAGARPGVAVVDLEAGHGAPSLRAGAPLRRACVRWSARPRLAALDGLLATVGASRSGAASRLGLRDADLEHAAVEARRHGVAVDALGQRQRAGERAERALHAVEALLALPRARPCAHRRRSACRPRARSRCPPRTCRAGRRAGRSGRRTRRGPWPAPSAAGRARRIRSSKAVLKSRFISLCSELSSRSGSQRTMVIEVPPFGTKVDLTAGPILRSQSGRIKSWRSTRSNSPRAGASRPRRSAAGSPRGPRRCASRGPARRSRDRGR